MGKAEKATIERCYFSGSVGSESSGGGIIGNCGEVVVTDCEAAGTVTNTFITTPSKTPNICLGGLVGSTSGNLTMKRCLARNQLTRRHNDTSAGYAGYLAGSVFKDAKATIENCVYWESGIPNNLTAASLTLTNCKAFTGSDATAMRGEATKSYLSDGWTYFNGTYEDYPVPTTLAERYHNDIFKSDANGLVYYPVGDNVNVTAYKVAEYKGNATSLQIPAQFDGKPVTAIGDEVFKDNETLATITLGENLETIGASAFEDCDELTAVDLPDKVTKVGKNAFRNCDNLKSFNIGKGFKDHDGNFLAYCPQLTTLTASRGNDNGYRCVDNVLIHNVGNFRSYVIVCAPGKKGDYVLPVADLTNATVNVYTECFASCDSLTSITFPTGKTYSLSERMFDEAYSLRYVDLRGMVQTIDNATYTVNRQEESNPFYGMSDYTMIYLPAGHKAAADEPNTIIDGKAQGMLMFDEDWGYQLKLNEIKAVDGVNMNFELSSERETVNQIMCDDDGNPILAKDEDGNYIEVGVYDEDGKQLMEEDGVTPVKGQLPQIKEVEIFRPRVYTLFLPYAFQISSQEAQVYIPTEQVDDEGKLCLKFTQSEMSESGNYELQANKPYLIVVEEENSIDPSTYETLETLVAAGEEPYWAVNGIKFTGTTVPLTGAQMSNNDQDAAFALSEDGVWRRVRAKDNGVRVNPFTAYLCIKDGSSYEEIPMILYDQYSKITLDEAQEAQNILLLEEYEGKKVDVDYSRELSAVQNADGTWTSRAYSICLPYDLPLHEQLSEKVYAKVYNVLYVDKEKKEIVFTNEFEYLTAGEPYIVVVNKGKISLNVVGKRVTSKATEADVLGITAEDVLGKWVGTFGSLSAEEAISLKAYGLRPDGTFAKFTESREGYTGWGTRYLPPFRAYLTFTDETETADYTIRFTETENDDESGELSKFPADQFVADGEEQVATAIQTVKTDDGERHYYDLQGRRVAKPVKGLYISNGKSVFHKE